MEEFRHILKVRIDASEFKDYIFAIHFLKRTSDAFKEARDVAITYYLGQGQSQQEEDLAKDQDESEKTFNVPVKAPW